MGGTFVRALLLVAVAIALVATPTSHALAQSPPNILETYRLPAERVVTLQPELRYQGRLYQIHYFTRGAFSSPNATLIGTATPASIARNQITGLLITADGRVVVDEAEIRQVLRLYRAAYHLSQLATTDALGFTDFYPFDAFRSDLKKITANPVFFSQMLSSAFNTRAQKNAEALRAMLTAQRSPPADIAAFSAELNRRLKQGEAFADAFDLTLEAARFSNSREVRRIAGDVRATLESWTPITGQGRSSIRLGGREVELFNALNIAQLGINLIWIQELQADRLALLAAYPEAFPTGDAALDRNALLAVATVKAEAEDIQIRRGTLILEFVQDRAVDVSKQLTFKRLSEEWVKLSWQKYGKRIKGHNAAGAAAAAGIGFTLAELLYGLDDLYSNFIVAESADDLRQRFYAGRRQIQQEARRAPPGPYDGELAARFRTAYMLEYLAAAQSFRSYADGVDATVNRGVLGVLSPINWWNWLRDNEWIEAAEGLRQQALKMEEAADETLGDPAFLEVAVDLVRERLQVAQSPLGRCLVGPGESVRLHAVNDEAGRAHVICIDLTDPYLRFQMVMANDVRSVNPASDQREAVASMVARAPYNLHNPILAFNADYFGAGHGPEGFAVANGFRLDGPHSNDNDGNATRRVSFSVSRTNHVRLGTRHPDEVASPNLLLSTFYNATGGGPTLVRNGGVVPNPCSGSFPSRVCRSAPQTAVGLASDGRRLIVVASENRDAEAVGRLLLSFGASEAIKLDGGSSTQLWYRGRSLIGAAPVANAILVFRERIPRHRAFLTRLSQYPVVGPGEPITLSLTLRNVGFLPWEHSLGYGLKLLRGTSLGLAEWQPVPATIQPNGDVEWVLPSRAPAEPGMYATQWQLVYRSPDGFEEAVSEPVGFVVTVLPEGTSPDVASMWRQLIDQAQEEARGRLEAFWESFQRQLAERIREELRKRIPPPLWCLFGLGLIASQLGLSARVLRGRRNRDSR